MSPAAGVQAVGVPLNFLEGAKLLTDRDRLPEIARAVKAIFCPGDIVEVRAFDKNGGKFVSRYGFGDCGEELATAIAKEDEAGRDTYYVCNPTSLTPVAAAAEGTKERD